MGLYSHIVRPMLFRLDPEWCHDWALGAARVMGGVLGDSFCDAVLETSLAGMKLRNPIGLAAGFDKSGMAVEGLGRLGFGHVEVGSISADPSVGNARPRLWRLVEDRGILVHYGLPNDGAEVVAGRLEKARREGVVVGANVVATNRGEGVNTTDEAVIEDYVRSVRALRGVADYFMLNLSCPNTDQGRNFFSCRGNLGRLLGAIEQEGVGGRPVFLKVSAAVDAAGMEELLRDVEGFGFVAGFSFNLPAGAPGGLKTARAVWESRAGAVSGKPVEKIVNAAVAEMWKRMDRRRYQIVAAGGVFTAEDAYEKIRLGASAVQVLTGLVYEGPGMVRRINRGLAALLRRDGFASASVAVGTMNGQQTSAI